MHRRAERALRAGFLALLVGLLCAAALAAPVVSTASDFAHSHPAGTTAHLHPVFFVLGGTPPPVPVVEVATEVQSGSAELPPATTSGRTYVLQPRSRGPPSHP